MSGSYSGTSPSHPIKSPGFTLNAFAKSMIFERGRSTCPASILRIFRRTVASVDAPAGDLPFRFSRSVTELPDQNDGFFRGDGNDVDPIAGSERDEFMNDSGPEAFEVFRTDRCNTGFQNFAGRFQ